MFITKDSVSLEGSSDKRYQVQNDFDGLSPYTNYTFLAVSQFKPGVVSEAKKLIVQTDEGGMRTTTFIGLLTLKGAIPVDKPLFNLPS